MSDGLSLNAISETRAKLSDEDLLDCSLQALEHAYAPYSGLQVGCAVASGDQRVFLGANMENASYGVTVCAEVAALSALNTHEGLSGIERLSLICREHGSPPRGIMPCGRCRQLIYEAAQVSGVDVMVLTRDRSGSLYRKRISTLLPDGFVLR
jgi:cytidine deaminase